MPMESGSRDSSDPKVATIGSKVPVRERSPMPPPASAEEAAGTYFQALVRYWPIVFGAVIVAIGIALLTISDPGTRTKRALPCS